MNRKEQIVIVVILVVSGFMPFCPIVQAAMDRDKLYMSNDVVRAIEDNIAKIKRLEGENSKHFQTALERAGIKKENFSKYSLQKNKNIWTILKQGDKK